MFCLLSFVMHVVLFSLLICVFGLAPPLAGLWVVPPFLFVLVFASCLAPPRHDGSLREGFDFGFPCLSACVLRQFAFLRLAPPATLTVRERLLTVVCLGVVLTRVKLL